MNEDILTHGENEFVEQYGVTKDDAFRHFGCDPADMEENGVGYGFWPRENALEMFAKQPEELPYLSEKKKIQIVFCYDPDFPVALHITRATLKCNEV
ncbi:hypothetical protein [Gemmiger sp.]|jgi:hypothetical protein